jgi:hypothetical protein
MRSAHHSTNMVACFVFKYTLPAPFPPPLLRRRRFFFQAPSSPFFRAARPQPPQSQRQGRRRSALLLLLLLAAGCWLLPPLPLGLRVSAPKLPPFAGRR